MAGDKMACDFKGKAGNLNFVLRFIQGGMKFIYLVINISFKTEKESFMWHVLKFQHFNFYLG